MVAAGNPGEEGNAVLLLSEYKVLITQDIEF